MNGYLNVLCTEFDRTQLNKVANKKKVDVQPLQVRPKLDLGAFVTASACRQSSIHCAFSILSDGICRASIIGHKETDVELQLNLAHI